MCKGLLSNGREVLREWLLEKAGLFVRQLGVSGRGFINCMFPMRLGDAHILLHAKNEGNRLAKKPQGRGSAHDTIQ